MDRLLLMQTFARAVEVGSFSAVAREQQIGQPSVSRQVANLERYLGTRLFHRSTRKLTLTPEGERYYQEARRVLDAVDEAESNARGEDKPRGLLRVACPTALARSRVLPWMRSFLETYPLISLELQIGDRFIDLVEEGVDLAIRIGSLKGSALRARRIGTAERVCVASAAYLKTRPAPLEVADLAHHECVVYSLAQSGSTWQFKTGEVTVSGRLSVNTPDGIHWAALDGCGIVYAPVWLFETALKQGLVQPLLLDEAGPAIPINLVYAANRLLPRRARVFMDAIAEHFTKDPLLNEGAVGHLVRRKRKRIGKAKRR